MMWLIAIVLQLLALGNAHRISSQKAYGALDTIVTFMFAALSFYAVRVA